MKKTVELFKNEPIETLKKLFNREESSGWNFQNAKNDLISNSLIVYSKYNYRPFDNRYIVYTGTSSGFLGRSRSIVMRHFINKTNIGICSMRQFFQDAPYSHIFITNCLIDERTMYSNRGGTYLFPLYLYPEDGSFEKERTPNLNMEIVNQIAEKLGLKFVNEKPNVNDKDGTRGLNPLLSPIDILADPERSPSLGGSSSLLSPLDILDYIYAVLHSPNYREKYKEFLKIDFPRVPYPENADIFWKLVKLGGEIRTIHLLENPIVEKYITTFPIDGDNKVIKIGFEDGKVWINKTQYFDKVPEIAWNFYIGGYQPAQKWLKDRKERTLSFDDIMHYQKIIVALTETYRLMKEIDEIKAF